MKNVFGFRVLLTGLALYVGFSADLSSAKLRTAPSKTSASSHKAAVVQAIKSSNFDFDDNIFVTGARIYLWDTKNDKEVSVSTADWANVKNLYGKPGEWNDFVLKPNGLRDFGDDTPLGTELFKKQIEAALESKTEKWKGPSWNAFVEAVSRPETRKYTTIITARMHSPESILKGLQVLKDRGLIPALPEKDNLFVVGSTELAPQYRANSPAESKAKVMIALIDGIDKKPVGKKAPEIDNPDGTGKARLHQWDFSDDDFDNIAKATAALSTQVAASRWPHTKITLYFTGRNNPEQQPHSIVIKSDGFTRETNPVEASRL